MNRKPNIQDLDTLTGQLIGQVPAQGGGRPPDAGMDVVGRWPELFTGLEPAQVTAIRQVFAAQWHEGWEPEREDVADLVAQTRGVIDTAEYMRRAAARAGRPRAV